MECTLEEAVNCYFVAIDEIKNQPKGPKEEKKRAGQRIRNLMTTRKLSYVEKSGRYIVLKNGKKKPRVDREFIMSVYKHFFRDDHVMVTDAAKASQFTDCFFELQKQGGETKIDIAVAKQKPPLSEEYTYEP